MKSVRTIVGMAAAVITCVLSSYATCYVAGTCTCAVVGSCYSQKVLPNCQVPTCLIADSQAATWNVCPGNGPYTGREAYEYPNVCCPSTCRMYDNCLHQYVGLSGSLCCFSIAIYQGVGSSCQ